MLTKALQTPKTGNFSPIARQDFDFNGWIVDWNCSQTSTIINEWVEPGSITALKGKRSVFGNKNILVDSIRRLCHFVCCLHAALIRSYLFVVIRSDRCNSWLTRCCPMHMITEIQTRTPSQSAFSPFLSCFSDETPHIASFSSTSDTYIYIYIYIYI